MAGENAELLRRAYGAFSDGDPDTVRAEMTEDVRWYPALAQFLERDLYEGPDAVLDLIFEEIPSVLEGFDGELLETIELGPALVVAVVRFKGRIARTGMAIEQTFGQVCHIRGGKLSEMRSYPSKHAALEALGLRSPAAGADDATG